MDIEKLFLTVWNMSLTGSMIIAFVLLARFFLRKAPRVFSYALWAVVLFRLLCPVSVSSVFSVLNFTRASEPVTQSVVSTMDYSAVEVPMLRPTEAMPEEPSVPVIKDEPVPELPQSDAPVVPERIPEILPESNELMMETAPHVRHEPAYYAAIVWLAGLLGMLVWNIYGCTRLFRQIDGAVPLRNDLYLADYIPTAFVLGFFKPKIYLPSYLAVEERGYIIAHERCHIKRKDHVFRLLGYIALCIHWFNPLVWLAYSLSGKDMEISCDETVIRMYGTRIRAEYAQSLLRLATGHRNFVLTPLAFGEGDTKERVINMSKWKKPKTLVTVAALVFCVIVLVACAVNPAQKESATEPTYWDRNKGSDETCIDAMDALLESESYYILYEKEYANDSDSIEYRRHGNDQLVLCDEDTDNNRVYLDGKLALYQSLPARELSYWVWQGKSEDYDPDAWLREWSPQYLETGSIRMGANTISIDVKWPHPYNEARFYKGTITYTFKADGSLESAYREAVLMEGDKLLRGYIDRITVMDESPEATLLAIRDIGSSCISMDEWKDVSEIQLPDSPLPERRSVGVRTVDELIAAIGPNTAISMEAGIYDLTKASGYGLNTDNPYCHWQKVYDGYELVIRNVTNLSISGAGINTTTLETAPRYANVIMMENCHDIWLHGFTAGHTRDRGECGGDVIELISCSNAELYELGLFGCGTVGLTARECSSITLRDSDIYDCSSSAVQLENSDFINITNCDIYEIGVDTDGAYAVFHISDCSELHVSGCKITDNLCNYLVAAGASYWTMKDCLIADNRFESAALLIPNTSTVFSHNHFRDNSIRNWYNNMSGNCAIDENGNRLTEDVLDEMYGRLDQPPGQAQLKVRVSTVDELIAAIGPNKEIILEAQTYDLSTATGYGSASGDYYYWQDYGDGPQLVIRNVDNMTLRGKNGKDSHSIVAVPRFANVLVFRACSNLTVSGITAGHTPGDVGCTGGVLFFRDCDHILVEESGLFGCGTVGVDVEDCEDINVRRCDIYECSEGGVRMRTSSIIRLEDNTFREISGNEYILLINCKDARRDGGVLIDANSMGTVRTADEMQMARNALYEALIYFQEYYWGNKPENLKQYLSESYAEPVTTYGQGDGSFLSLHFEVTFDHVREIEEKGSATFEIPYRPYKYDEGEKRDIIRYLLVTAVKENGAYKISRYQQKE